MTASSANVAINSSLKQRLHILFSTLRPRQWTKNLIVFAPALFALELHDLTSLWVAGLTFISFCLVSGAVYVLNDVFDLESDRKHPVKSQRAIASGAVSTRTAITFGIAAAVIGIAIGAAIRPALCAVLIAYICLQILYSVSLKHQVLLDVGCIAAGFVLRAISGAVAIHVPSSGWFLLCTGLAALFLALEKRRQELRILGDSAVTCRAALRCYSLELMNRLEAIVLPALVVSYMLYSFQSWHGQWMMLTVPFMLYGIARYIQISTDTTLTVAPEEILLKDVPIQITLLLWTLTSVLVVYGVLPHAIVGTVHFFDHLGPNILNK